jgi:hypothetical protein
LERGRHGDTRLAANCLHVRAQVGLAAVSVPRRNRRSSAVPNLGRSLQLSVPSTGAFPGLDVPSVGHVRRGTFRRLVCCAHSWLGGDFAYVLTWPQSLAGKGKGECAACTGKAQRFADAVWWRSPICWPCEQSTSCIPGDALTVPAAAHMLCSVRLSAPWSSHEAPHCGRESTHAVPGCRCSKPPVRVGPTWPRAIDPDEKKHCCC